MSVLDDPQRAATLARRVSIQQAIGQHADRIIALRHSYDRDPETTGSRISLLLSRTGAIAEQIGPPPDSTEDLATGLLCLAAEVQIWLEALAQETTR